MRRQQTKVPVDYTHAHQFLYVYSFFYRYVANVKYLGDSFLKSQGYSSAVHFDPHRPTESVATILDAVFKRHFGLKINSGKYIRPAIFYIQVTLFFLSLGRGQRWKQFFANEDQESDIRPCLFRNRKNPALFFPSKMRVQKRLAFSLPTVPPDWPRALPFRVENSEKKSHSRSGTGQYEVKGRYCTV